MNFIEKYQVDEGLCDELINFFENSECHPGCSGASTVNKDVKDSWDAPLEGPLKLRYFNELVKCMKKYRDKYRYCHEHIEEWTMFPYVNLQKYNPGQCYSRMHCERGSYKYDIGLRHLVFMTYLNDVEDGGETEFYYQEVKIQPRKGLTLIWPAEWTHVHRGHPSATQVKYIVTGWLSYIPENIRTRLPEIAE